MDDLQPAYMLNNYRIEKKVGQGGMSMVYKAYYASTDCFIADKDMPSRLTQDRKLSNVGPAFIAS
jgi:serine/threonine protein kinase